MKLTPLLLSVCISVQVLADTAKELNVYRNDRLFYNFKIDDDFTIDHADYPSVSFSSPERRISIPVSSIDSLVIRAITVPSLRFTFPDYPDVGQVWDKESYINAELDIDGFGVVEDAAGLTLQVKGRGNSTWGMDKKPMRLKFKKKTSICGFAEAKSYVLLADYLDPSMMRNAVGLWLARRLGMRYANHTQPCNVYINGMYAGLYLLTEKVGINSGSVDIDKNTGILFEMSREYDEKYQFRSGVWNIPVMVKDPDFDELYAADPDGPTPEERFEMWKADFNAAADAAVDGVDIDGFDIESAVNYLLTVNVVCNSEVGYPKSIYVYKEALGEKYKLGPVWDLDVAWNFYYAGTEGELLSVSPDSELWVSGVLDMLCDNSEFKRAYKARFEEFKSTIFPEMLEFIDRYAAIIESSAKMNAVRWPEEYVTSWYYRITSFDRHSQVKALKTWVVQRVEYLNRQVEAGEIL